MATFPTYAKIVWPDTSEQHASAVLRSDVERGIPRTRRNAADALVSVSVTLQLFTPQRVADFESWFYAEAMAGAAWFSFTHPRTGAVVQGRMVGGFGPVRQMGNQTWSLPAVIEYIRPGFIQLPPGLHSVNPTRVLSVQRNSAATYVDDAGVLQTAAANVLRYQGGQVLVEGEATNLLLSSESFSGAAYYKSELSVVDGAVAGVGGVGVASLITVTGADPHVFQWCDVFGGQTYTFSFWVKGFGPAAGKAAAFLSWFTGTATGPSVFQNFVLPSELTRLSFQFTPDTSGSVVVRLDLPQNPWSSVGDEVGLKGWQLEFGDLSSYIPTTTAPVTRAADIITVAA